MAAPTVTLVSETATRISAQTGKDSSVVVFQSDQDLAEWEARADGSGHGSGDLVGQSVPGGLSFDDLDSLAWNDIDGEEWNILDGSTILKAGDNASFDVENEELTWGDRAYRINVYGKNLVGEWTPYG